MGWVCSLGFFHRNGELLRFSINICNRKRPKRNQVDSRYEFGEKRGQKLPVPTKQVRQRASNAEIQQVIGR